MPKPSKAKREKRKKEQEQENRKYQKDKKRRQKEEQRRQKDQHASKSPNPSIMSEDAWEELVQKALKRSDFDALQHLFLESLLQYGKTSMMGDTKKSMIKRYRELSIRFHPDKHSSEMTCFKIAFQALNEARETIEEL
eukprot:scaffold22660_cov127-Cylindrotheca_fusiformis.AAC.1